MRPFVIGCVVNLVLFVVPVTVVQADVRVVKLDGSVLEGRFYDLGNEYLEMESRLGSSLLLKREV